MKKLNYSNKLKLVVFICSFAFFFLSFEFTCFAIDLGKIKSDFISGDYKAAIKEGEDILAEAKHSRNLDEVYYFLGLSYLKDGNYLRAWDIFEIIVKEYKDSRFVSEARLGTGDAHFFMGNFDKARQVYKDLLAANYANKADLYYRLIQCAVKLDDAGSVKLYREKLAKEFPLYTESPSVLESPQGTNSFSYSVQVGSFSREINALNLSRQLNKKGFNSYMEKINSADKTVFRVKVGRLQKRAEAVVLADKLSLEGYSVKVCP